MCLTVITVQVDRIIGVAKGRNRLPGLAAVLGAIVRREVDAIVVQSLHHLGSSVDTLLETLAELNRHGVKLVVHDNDDAVETGGLLAAADLLVEARQAYRRENIVGRPTESEGRRCPFWSPARAFRPSGEGASGALAGQGVRQAAEAVLSVPPRCRGSKPRWLWPGW